MRSFIAVSVLAAAAAVHAQSSTSSSATPTSTAISLIPTGISSGCSSYLQSLNSNATLSSCIAPVVSATANFGPLSNNNSSASSSAINSALGTLCASSSSSCDVAIRSQLTSFYAACDAELTGESPNQDVIRIYDVLYTITPLQKAVCTKDDSGNYCVTQATSTLSSGSSAPSASVSAGGSKAFVSTTKQSVYELVQNNLWSYASSSSLTKRASEDGAALIPNTTTYRTTNLPFLFLSSGLSSSELCVSCTRSVLSAYMTFEQSVPYALSIANSPMLGGQTDLYKAVTSECGSSFLSGAVQAAGGLSGGLVSGATPRISSEGGLFTAAAAAVLGLVSLL